MADAKISALTALTGANLAAGDLIPVVDVSATTAGSKQMTITEFLTGILGSTSKTGATETTSKPLLDLAQTWNDGAVAFTGLKFNATSTGSAVGSLLLDLSVDGTGVFQVRKNGTISIGNPTTSNGVNLRYSGSGIGFERNDTGYTSSHTWIGYYSRPQVITADSGEFAWASSSDPTATLNPDVRLARDAAGIMALRNSTNAQESRVYGSFTSDTNFQRLSIKTVREVSTTLSGATFVSTATIPAYAHLIGVTTRVNTVITGATSYSVGDGTDADLWGANIGIAANSQSRTADFTAVGAVGATAAARNVTLTANGSNFTGGVVEICVHYLHTEAD